VESPLLDGPRALSIIIYICNNSYVYDSISSSLPDYTNDFGSCTIAQNDQQQSINFTSLFEQSHSDSSFEYQ
jgi:hypothetical protein